VMLSYTELCRFRGDIRRWLRGYDGKSGHIEVEIKCRVTNLDLCTCCLLSTASLLLPADYCLPYCLPSSAARVLPAVQSLPSTASRLLPPVNYLPCTACHLLPVDFLIARSARSVAVAEWHFDGSERQRAEEKCCVMGRTGRGHLTEMKSV
jgi:hypothetical protein